MYPEFSTLEMTQRFQTWREITGTAMAAYEAREVLRCALCTSSVP